MSGIHTEGESHFDLLAAFAPARLLTEAMRFAESQDFTSHELGDVMLVAPEVIAA